MKNYIDNIDFHNLAAMKYWAPPASWDDTKKRSTTRERIYSGEWLGARKMDGSFWKFVKDEDGNMELLGRSKSVSGDYLNKIEWVPHLNDFFNVLPNGTCLIGELVFTENEGSKNVTTIMGCLKEKAIQRQKENKLHFYVFDVLAWAGESYITKPAQERFEKLKELPSHKWVITATYYSGDELWTQLQMILADGGEGIVMTRASAPYQPDKRPSKDTQKVKKEIQDTIDCFIIGANAPTKIYTGKQIEDWTLWFDEKNEVCLPEKNMFKDYQCGAMIVPVTKNFYYKWAGSLKLGLVKNGVVEHFGDLSGLTQEVLSNWRDYIGKVCEVGGMEIDPESGHIRHPKFLGWRADKTPAECLWSQVEMEDK